MSKQELIDRCVEKKCGCIGAGNAAADVIILEDDEFFAVTLGYLKGVDENKYSVVCTRTEFEQRAKELGWVYGYKWGVEYATGGVKPNLPEGTLLEITFNDGAFKYKARLDKTTFDFRPMYDPRPTSFKIIDECYKPVSEITESKPKTGNVSDWYNYDKQEAIALPPTSAQCEWKGLRGGKWVQCEVIDKYQNNEMVVFNTGDYRNCKFEILDLSATEFRPLDWSRKAEEDKKRVVETALSLIDEKAISLLSILSKLYDLGFLKLPEQK